MNNHKFESLNRVDIEYVRCTKCSYVAFAHFNFAKVSREWQHDPPNKEVYVANEQLINVYIYGKWDKCIKTFGCQYSDEDMLVKEIIK